MAIELTQEGVQRVVTNISNVPTNAVYNINEVSNESESITPFLRVGVESSASNEYELNSSESLSFLYNLLWEDDSNLSKADILLILHALEERERSIPFSHRGSLTSDTQGISWPPNLWDKFKADRELIGSLNWCHNIPNSRESIKSQLNLQIYQEKTDYFKFYRFFGKVKLNITHFQLRNLVCCNTLEDGIYYPSTHIHEDYIPNQTPYNYDETPSYFKVNKLSLDNSLSPKQDSLMLSSVLDSRKLRYNSSSRIACMSCSDNLFICGTFEGGFILKTLASEENSIIEEVSLTSNSDGITNHIAIVDDSEVICSSNDKFLRFIDIEQKRKCRIYNEVYLDFAVNCLNVNPNNTNEMIITGDNINSFFFDKRVPFTGIDHLVKLEGHQDYGFACDWSPKNENYLITGNQDCSVKFWDRRNCTKSLYCWDSAFGKSKTSGGPVRNCKFSMNGDYLSWAESLDHIGVINVNELLNTPDEVPYDLSRVQSIDFVGKCTGINFIRSQNGDEELIFGVSDCPLGGIFNYKLESRNKFLDFDFSF